MSEDRDVTEVVRSGAALVVYLLWWGGIGLSVLAVLATLVRALFE